MAVLYKGTEYRAVDEYQIGSCAGCVFDADVKACYEFHKNNRCVECAQDGVIFELANKEILNAAS